MAIGRVSLLVENRIMSKLLKITRREYKAMLDPRLFVDRKPAVEEFCRELKACVHNFPKMELDGKPKTADQRLICFLDTSDQAICSNRFVFRERRDAATGAAELTLKCRSPDRYVAAGADVAAAKGCKQDRKFEEDIGAPFVTRFSHSTTIRGSGKRPEKLSDAAKLFPVLGQLQRDGRSCPGSLTLGAVNNYEVFERVLKGVTLRLQKTVAEVAMIFWSNGQAGRPLVAEFSFRYRSDDEDYSPKVAQLAMSFFQDLQRLDWFQTAGRTKTQFVFGE